MASSLIYIHMLRTSHSVLFLQAMVSVKRVTRFLQADEVDPDNVQHQPAGE